MRMYLTQGMFGRELEQIGGEFKTLKEAMLGLEEWKSSETSQAFYRIEPYDRFIFDEKLGETAIDFGDYSHFIMLTEDVRKEWGKGTFNESSL